MVKGLLNLAPIKTENLLQEHYHLVNRQMHIVVRPDPSQGLETCLPPLCQSNVQWCQTLSDKSHDSHDFEEIQFCLDLKKGVKIKKLN